MVTHLVVHSSPVLPDAGADVSFFYSAKRIIFIKNVSRRIL